MQAAPCLVELSICINFLSKGASLRDPVHDIQGSSFHFIIDPGDVLPDDAEPQKIYATKEGNSG